MNNKEIKMKVYRKFLEDKENKYYNDIFIVIKVFQNNMIIKEMIIYFKGR